MPRRIVPVTAFLVLAIPSLTCALINPNFTPINLVKESGLILRLKVSPADDTGRARAEVVKVIKGESGKSATLDLGQIANVAAAGKLRAAIAALGDEPALLFMGKGEDSQTASKLHIGGMWFNLDKGGVENTWTVDNIDIHMEATWAGGTDMLLRMVELIVACPDTEVPCGCTSKWENPCKVGKVEGVVHGSMAVDVAGKGDMVLFVMAEGGDRVFSYAAKTKEYVDVTGRWKLASKSVVAAWGDFNGDGKLDLASFDGKGLTIWYQKADGTFAATPVTNTPPEACLGLTALDVGVKGCAGLVWSGRSAPTLLCPDKGKTGTFQLRALATVQGAIRNIEGPGACLVADFDNDGIADILEPFAGGSVFFKGRARGEFSAGQACRLALGKGRASAFMGDFDADGRMDVVTMAEDCLGLWENQGNGQFKNVFSVDGKSTSGELSYIPPPKAIGGNVCDINGDGLQDILFVYPNVAPELFFNRGFRSFGHAHQPIDLDEAKSFPETLAGVQAGAVADFNGDGAQDMALVLPDGGVYVLNMVTDGTPQAVRVVMTAGGDSAGPVLVSAESDDRPLGAWLVAPGTSEAFVARKDPGVVTVSWGAGQKKTFTLQDKVVRFVVGQEK